MLFENKKFVQVFDSCYSCVVFGADDVHSVDDFDAGFPESCEFCCGVDRNVYQNGDSQSHEYFDFDTQACVIWKFVVDSGYFVLGPVYFV